MNNNKLQQLKSAKAFKDKRKVLVTIGASIGLSASLFLPSNQQSSLADAAFVPKGTIRYEDLGAFPIIEPNIKFGFTLDTFLVEENTIKRNQTLGTLLSSKGVEIPVIEGIIANSKGVANLSKSFKTGQDYLLLSDQGTQSPMFLVLEPSVFEYLVLNLQNGNVQKVEREVSVNTRAVEGQIYSSLWGALSENGISPEVAAKMEDALEFYVDFSHTQNGDEFKLLYEEKSINGKSVGAGQVYAAYYLREGKEFYSFWFDNGEHKGFYDFDGSSSRKGFLKSPLKYTRISSNFNPRRFHPILKEVRPHLGTDYAAPAGTPIYAVGDGVVEEATFSRGNGKYVKIKHDKTYQTQYLHMSRFAKGIKRGTKVAQGQVIGYVGSTGLATGPHVCFRFWKNGKQVNHLREKLPVSKKLPKEVLPDFFKVRDRYLLQLSGQQPIEPEQTAGDSCATAGDVAP